MVKETASALSRTSACAAVALLANLHDNVITTPQQHKLRRNESGKLQSPEAVKCRAINMSKQKKNNQILYDYHIAFDTDMLKPFAMTICFKHAWTTRKWHSYPQQHFAKLGFKIILQNACLVVFKLASLLIVFCPFQSSSVSKTSIIFVFFSLEIIFPFLSGYGNTTRWTGVDMSTPISLRRYSFLSKNDIKSLCIPSGNQFYLPPPQFLRARTGPCMVTHFPKKTQAHQQI